MHVKENGSPGEAAACLSWEELGFEEWVRDVAGAVWEAEISNVFYNLRTVMHDKENGPSREAAAFLQCEELGFESFSACALAFAAFRIFFCLA